MLTLTRNTTYPDYVGASQIRGDYFRQGAVVGGIGEGVWAAGTCEMLINAAAADVSFSFGPPADQSFVIDKVVVGLVCGTAPGIAEFANLGAALGDGVLYQISRTTPAETTTLVNLEINPDFMKLGNRDIQDDGVNAFISSVWQPVSADMPLVLHGRTGDTLQLVIRDNMTLVGGTTMWAYGFAHVLG